MYSKIQYISQGNTPDEHLVNIKKALDAGINWVQLRMKTYHEEIVLETAIAVRKLTLNYDATFILNDYAELVHHCDADGVHVGKNDVSPKIARSILGDGYIVGGTANSDHDMVAMVMAEVDYIGLGPFSNTTTKKNPAPVLKRESFVRAASLFEDTSIKIPVFAIGGIELEDLDEISKTGVYGIAASGMFTDKEDLEERVKKIKRILYEKIED
jgi:thiamine-phosphate pyrophosphorylase